MKTKKLFNLLSAILLICSAGSTVLASEGQQNQGNQGNGQRHHQEDFNAMLDALTSPTGQRPRVMVETGRTTRPTQTKAAQAERKIQKEFQVLFAQSDANDEEQKRQFEEAKRKFEKRWKQRK